MDGIENYSHSPTADLRAEPVSADQEIVGTVDLLQMLDERIDGFDLDTISTRSAMLQMLRNDLDQCVVKIASGKGE